MRCPVELKDRLPLVDILPVTLNLSVGAVLPMPTLPLVSIRIFSLPPTKNCNGKYVPVPVRDEFIAVAVALIDN